jgi:hypothetical protein
VEEPEPVPAPSFLQGDQDYKLDGMIGDADILHEDMLAMGPDGTGQGNSQVSPRLLAQREIALNGGGLSNCTTAMVRNIPFKYTQRKLVREINSMGFLGSYDFLYLPMDPRSHANRGFAFINLISPEIAEDFYKKFHGQQLRHFCADKPIAVLPADLQGFEENALRYAATSTQRGRRTGHTKPIFFRPLPAHVVAQLGDSKFSGNATMSNNVDAARHRSEAPEEQDDFLAGFGVAVAGLVRLQQQQQLQHQHHGQQQQVLEHPSIMKLPTQLRQPQQQEPFSQSMQCQRPGGNFCVYCGKPRLTDHSFCPYCGNKF